MECPRCGKAMALATKRPRRTATAGLKAVDPAGWVCSDVACPGKL